jgi:CHAT domain-containing protein
MLADARRYASMGTEQLAFRQRGEDPAARGSIDSIKFLPGTKVEADSIVSTIRQSRQMSLDPTLYVGQNGTEASFKALSGMRKKVLHVATHGYFYNLSDSTFNRFGLGDNPLVRSGLYFAGANNKWFGEPIPAGVDDGFLTSLEIANLDFRGVDMVAMSACETGKGNISGDGVFGLQRGFKMAGANSILMSLWKVDDDATCLLMTEFYKNWMKGMDKNKALNAAKNAVRSHTEKGWDNPRYWAAFILLDGLD